jgi:TolB-like protein
MKILIHTCVIIQILVTPLLASKVLFIQNFENNSKDPKYTDTGKALADMIISDLVSLNIEGVQIVERARIDSLIGELKLQESAYFDPTSTQKMGKGLGANLALAGSFVVMGGEMRIDARLIDVTTSEIQLSFKSKGLENDFFELEEDLINNIGKGLAIDIKTIKQDKLSGPATLGALIKYGEAIGLKDKGEYKAASDRLSDLRKDDPNFRLSESAYKEVMKKLYESKEKRDNIMSEGESKLHESALQKSKTDNHKVGFIYQAVLMKIYFRQMKKIAEIDESSSFATNSLDLGWKRKMHGKKTSIRDNQMEIFSKNLKLYVESYAEAINHASKLDTMALMSVNKSLSHSDKILVTDLGWDFNMVSLHLGTAYMLDDLATFLLAETDFIPPPYKINEKYRSLGFELLDQATKEAANPKNPHRIRDTCRQMTHHGDILLEHKRNADAIAKWQQILDEFPTYEDFKSIEEKIKKALE